MQYESQMVIVAKTSDLAAALALLGRHGATSATISVQRGDGHLALELLCPRNVSERQALVIGAELADQPTCREVMLKVVRGPRDGLADGLRFVEECAVWPKPPVLHEWPAAA